MNKLVNNFILQCSETYDYAYTISEIVRSDEESTNLFCATVLLHKDSYF